MIDWHETNLIHGDVQCSPRRMANVASRNVKQIEKSPRISLCLKVPEQYGTSSIHDVLIDVRHTSLIRVVAQCSRRATSGVSSRNVKNIKETQRNSMVPEQHGTSSIHDVLIHVHHTSLFRAVAQCSRRAMPNAASKNNENSKEVL